MRANLHIRGRCALLKGVPWVVLQNAAERLGIEWLVSVDVGGWPSNFDTRHQARIWAVELATDFMGQHLSVLAFFKEKHDKFSLLVERQAFLLGKDFPTGQLPTTQLGIEAVRECGGVAILSGWSLDLLPLGVLQEFKRRGLQGIDLDAKPMAAQVVGNLETLGRQLSLLLIRGSKLACSEQEQLSYFGELESGVTEGAMWDCFAEALFGG